MSLVFNMVGGGSGGGSDTYAFIVVTYPAGSTCTASDGTTTLTAPDTSGSWVCKVPNAGTWTVTSTNGTDTATANVSITTEGQSESVELSYALYLIKDGVQVRQFDFVRSGTTVTQESSSVHISGTSGYVLFVYAIVDDGVAYSQFVLETSASGNSYRQGDCPGTGYSLSAPSINSDRLVSPKTEETLLSNNETIAVNTFTCQVSGTATKYVWVALSGASGYSGNIYIKNLYLAR